MPRKAKSLAPIEVQRIKGAGLHFVGEVPGLALSVSAGGSRSWVLRVTVAGKRRDVGLGGFPAVTLAEARGKAREAREAIGKGVDPIEARKAAQSAAKAAREAARTFDQCAVAYIAAKESGWSNPKHADQWRNTLATYASPHFGALLVRDVDTPHVMAALEPIWSTKTETATRLRGRIEAILDWATVKGLRSGPNPARWRGHLALMLAKPRSVSPTVHYPAVPVREVGAFMLALRAADGMASRCLEFLTLTTVRSGEARSAEWHEIDLEAAEWNIPAPKMKRKRPHRVPLSAEAVHLLRSLPRFHDVSLVFPGQRAGSTLSDMSLSAVMRRMKVQGVDGQGQRTQAVPHGLRSTFRDWAGERTNHPRAVVEAALAHAVGNATEAAYARSDLFERRRNLMQDWARFLHRVEKPGQVIELRVA